MVNFNDLTGALDDQEKQKQADAERAKQLEVVSASGEKVAKAVDDNTKGLKDIKGEVKVTNPDLAKSSDVNSAVEAINKLNLTTFMQNEGLPQLADNLSQLSVKTQDLQDKLENEGLKKMSDQLSAVVKKLDDVAKVISQTEVSVDVKLQKTIDNLSKSIDSIDFNPSVNVSAPDTKVVTTPIDLSSVVTALGKVEKAVSSQEVPDNDVDLSPVTSGLQSVQDAITSLRFPVPNYVLPFRNQDGKAVQVQLNADGTIPTSGGSAASSIAINDGATTSRKATVVSLTNSNPLAVEIVDGAGSQITSFGGGAQYTDGSSTITHPIGTIPVYDKSGTITAVSVSNPLPVNASVSTPADLAPATQNITVVDSSSVTTSMANNQSFIIGTPTAGSAGSFSLSSIETIRVEVTGIWTGTLATETSIDGGTTWVSQGVHQGAYTTSSFTLGFVGGCNVSGATNFRVRATTAITGTAVVKIIESVNTQSVYIANAAPSGTVISALNSSSATLTSGSVYTGTGEDVTNFSEMRVSVFSDVASATDGLSLQQSSNGTNWDITDTYTVSLSAAGAGKTYVVPRQARFFRVVYTNGGTNQTTFRLQTILNRTATAPSSQRATDGYTNETDLVQNQTFLMGYNGTTWDRIRTVGTGVVSTSAVLTAGAALIGKVGIDQTTPGTTNAVSANQGTAAALASGWPVLNGEASDTTGTFTNATQTTSVTASSLDGYGNVLISINGTYGTATAVFEGSDDGGTTWYGISEADRTDSNIIESGYTSLTNTARAWQISNPGWDSVRVRSTAVASGTVNVRISPSAAPTSAGASVSIGVALPTGANTIGALTANQSVNVAQINGVTPLMGNGVTGTGSHRVTIASDNTAFSVNVASEIPGVGATNLGKAEDAGHTSGDTGVFMLGVRNDSVAAFSGTDLDYTPIATDSAGTQYVVQKSATATLTNVASSATSVTLLSANTARKGAQIYNDSTQICYVKFGTTASTTSFTVPLAAATYYELPAGYTGRIDAIWASANGNARITEET